MTSTIGGRPLRPGGLAQTATLSWLLVLAVEWLTNILACCLPVALRSLSYPMVSAMRQHPWPCATMRKGCAGLQCCLPAMVSQDVVKTEFKLVASYEGWEYVVLSHELGHHVEPEDRKLCVTVRHRQCAAVQPSFSLAQIMTLD